MRIIYYIIGLIIWIAVPTSVGFYLGRQDPQSKSFPFVKEVKQATQSAVCSDKDEYVILDIGAQQKVAQVLIISQLFKFDEDRKSRLREFVQTHQASKIVLR